MRNLKRMRIIASDATRISNSVAFCLLSLFATLCGVFYNELKIASLKKGILRRIRKKRAAARGKMTALGRRIASLLRMRMILSQFIFLFRIC